MLWTSYAVFNYYIQLFRAQQLKHITNIFSYTSHGTIISSMITAEKLPCIFSFHCR